MKKYLAYTVTILFGLAIICGISYCIYLCNETNDRVAKSIELQIAAQDKEEEDTTPTEDPQYVTICSQYEVLDTKAISDAYITKNTSLLTTDYDKETYKLASAVLDKIIKNTMTLSEKELAIHDWIASNISRNDSPVAAIPSIGKYSDRPGGVLKYKTAVCVGYATTFKLLMNMVGAECMVMHNTEKTHTWDLLKLDDNQWYFIDLYSNDCGTIPSHAYFNCDPLYFRSTHQFDQNLYPVAIGSTYIYSKCHNTKLADITKLPYQTSEVLKKKQSEAYFSISKKSDITYITTFFNELQQRSGENFYCDYTITDNDSDSMIICLFVTYFNNSEKADSDKYPELIKIMDKLFGESQNYMGDK